MRAVAVREWGGPDALTEVELPTPVPGAGEVRLRVHAAAVNPTDTVFRSGGQRDGASPPPNIPGMDAAGVVDAIGPDVDDRLAVGDRVVALTVPDGPGAYADSIVVPAASVVPAPADADFAAASTLLMNAATARRALDVLGLAAGQTLAVTGAAGALGGYLIQLARADGLRVIADARDSDRDLVTSLGADVVVPRGDDVARAIREVAPEGVDAVADAAVQRQLVVPAVRDGGAVAEFRGWQGPAERGVTVRAIRVRDVLTDTGLLDRLRRLADEGVLTLRVAAVLPAGGAAEAHRRLEAGGVRGRLVLDFTR